jgi:hypothetical protein
VCESPLTSLAAAAARADFQRARRRHFAARARRRLTTRHAAPTRPADLGDVAALFWRPARLRPIPLEAIVGTVDATTDFDANFRPTTDRVSSRWQRVARAYRDGRPLPPVAVIERPEGYYVLDGRHRVSVARALGHRDIDAWASPAPQGPAPHALTPEERPMTRLPRRVLLAVTRALHADQAFHDRVHFHAGDHGRPYVCEERGCNSPSLNVVPS